MQALAFVDLETSGSTTGSDRITEIGIVTVDADGTVKTWQQLVNPETVIPPFIQQLTGINNEMVADAPVFAEIADTVQQLLAGRLFIAHNAHFDYGFLKQEFKRIGRIFRTPVLCTVKLSRLLYPEYKKHNLDALIERHDLQAEARHRALADAQLIHQFWQKIHVDRDQESLTTAFKALNPQPVLPAHIDNAIIDELPDTPGIFNFYDEKDQAIFTGQAKDLRKRVLSYFFIEQRSAREARLAERIRKIEWEEAETGSN